MRAMKSIQTAGAGGASLMSFVPADHGIQQEIPTTYNLYAGYSPYFSDCGYPLSYYQAAAYGGGLQGAQQQYAVFGGGATAAAGLTMAAANSSGLYPFFQYGPAASVAAAGYSLAQYPQLYQYAAAGMGATTAAATLTTVAGGLQQYAGAVAFTPNSIGQADDFSGMSMSMTAPTLPAPTAQYQFTRLIPSHLAAAPDQKPSLA
ncbi:RNA-binding protein 24-B-like [Panicum miliaceum]|uniref:RNA-binding protein 24-B-like n=1 Tax=Panicum miliaceum TaxID=4540 RepID=A0A3L6SJT6_PANMI|nr:RNA-binding protein 24-B-like [Panicum miliaceum]